MDGFAVARWRRYGQDRLYVNRASDGEAVGWYDFKSGQVVVSDENCRSVVLDALTPYLETPSAVPPVASAGSPPPPREALPHSQTGDLSSNRPGDALRRKILDEEPVWWKRKLARWLSGEATKAHSWAVGLYGERIVGARLNRLARRGWSVLHSIELPSGSDIDHLIIGPPGVFTINTKHHKGSPIWQGDRVIMVNGAAKRYIPISLSEAERTAKTLSRACGFSVSVRPVLAVVGASRITVKSASSDVLLVDGTQVDRLMSGLSPQISAEQVQRIYAAARRRETWER